MIKYPKKQDLQDAKKDSVNTLQYLYSIVAALALTQAILKIGKVWPYTESKSNVVALTIAFLSTLVPFYHGMNRHLYETHVRNPETGEHGRPIPLLIDIFVFIAESGLLFAMGQKLDDPSTFILFWGSLLLIDILWSIVVWRFQKGEKPKWAVNNGAWLSIVIIAYLVHRMFLPSWSAVATGVYLLVVVEVCRSIIDYYLNWNYYFPWAPLSLRRISGRVIDQNRQPVINSSVSLTDKKGRLSTASVDSSGNFAITAASGHYRLAVEATGFCIANSQLRLGRWPRGGIFRQRQLVIHMEVTHEDGYSHVEYK